MKEVPDTSGTLFRSTIRRWSSNLGYRLYVWLAVLRLWGWMSEQGMYTCMYACIYIPSGFWGLQCGRWSAFARSIARMRDAAPCAQYRRGSPKLCMLAICGRCQPEFCIHTRIKQGAARPRHVNVNMLAVRCLL